MFYKDTLIQDTIFQFFSTGYFRSESNFINIPTVYYYQSYGSCFGRYNYERIKNNLTKGKFNHFKDTFMIPIDSLNFAFQLDYIESIGFIYYESNSDLRFNHTSIISGEKEWTITNNMGRIVQRGYLDASKGDNNYTILIYDLPKGNYTLEIGDRSDAVDESFTVR